MNKPSDPAKEEQILFSAESSDGESSNSNQIYGNDLAEAYKEDLYKNQWIPLAIIAVFLLIAAVGVSTMGGLALKFAEPTKAPGIITDPMPSPNTESPTPTLTPTPTATATALAPVMLRVLPSSANMRSAPSLTARVIGQVKKGSLANPLIVSTDGRWFLVIIQENGSTGWVANELFETVSGDVKTLPTVAPTSP